MHLHSHLPVHFMSVSTPRGRVAGQSSKAATDVDLILRHLQQ